MAKLTKHQAFKLQIMKAMADDEDRQLQKDLLGAMIEEATPEEELEALPAPERTVEEVPAPQLSAPTAEQPPAPEAVPTAGTELPTEEKKE